MLFLTNRTLLFLSVCLISLQLLAQNEIRQGGYVVEAKYKTGLVIPHHSFMNYVIQEPQYGFEIQFKKRTRGSTIYDSLYRFPLFGCAFEHSTLGNNDKLGALTMVSAIIEAPIWKHKKCMIGYLGNIGFAYAHKPYSKSVYNVSLTSPLNILVGFDFLLQYQLSQKSFIRANIELQHVSNGKVKTPNLGYNSVFASLSYVYSLKTKDFFDSVQQSTFESKNHTIRIGMAGFYKRDDYLNTTKYPAITTNIDYEHALNCKYALVFGGNLFYDKSIAAIEPLITTKDLFEFGLHSGFSVRYNRMVFFAQIGNVLWHQSKKPWWYNRVGLRYERDNWYINYSLKSYTTTADYMECGLGYTIHWN